MKALEVVPRGIIVRTPSPTRPLSAYVSENQTSTTVKGPPSSQSIDNGFFIGSQSLDTSLASRTTAQVLRIPPKDQELFLHTVMQDLPIVQLLRNLKRTYYSFSGLRLSRERSAPSIMRACVLAYPGT